MIPFRDTDGAKVAGSAWRQIGKFFFLQFVGLRPRYWGFGWEVISPADMRKYPRTYQLIWLRFGPCDINFWRRCCS